MPSNPSTPFTNEDAIRNLRNDPAVYMGIRTARNANACLSCKMKKKRCEPGSATHNGPCKRCYTNNFECVYEHPYGDQYLHSTSPTIPSYPPASMRPDASATSSRHRSTFATGPLPPTHLVGLPQQQSAFIPYPTGDQANSMFLESSPFYTPPDIYSGMTDPQANAQSDMPYEATYLVSPSEIDCQCTLELTCQLHDRPIRRLQGPSSSTSNNTQSGMWDPNMHF